MAQPLLRRWNVARSLFLDTCIDTMQPVGPLEALGPTRRRRRRPKLGTTRRLLVLRPATFDLRPGLLRRSRRTPLTFKALFLRAPEQRRKRPLSHTCPLGVTGHRGPPLPA